MSIASVLNYTFLIPGRVNPKRQKNIKKEKKNTYLWLDKYN
jgi:hypothetical protein